MLENVFSIFALQNGLCKIGLIYSLKSERTILMKLSESGVLIIEVFF